TADEGVVAVAAADDGRQRDPQQVDRVVAAEGGHVDAVDVGADRRRALAGDGDDVGRGGDGVGGLAAVDFQHVQAARTAGDGHRRGPGVVERRGGVGAVAATAAVGGVDDEVVVHAGAVHGERVAGHALVDDLLHAGHDRGQRQRRDVERRGVAAGRR